MLLVASQNPKAFSVSVVLSLHLLLSSTVPSLHVLPLKFLELLLAKLLLIQFVGKASLKEVQEILRAEREEKEQLKKAADEEKEQQRQKKLSDSEKQLEAIRKIEEKLEEERKERQQLRTEIEERDSQDKLRRYRENAIQAAGPEIIQELVTGSSETEIDAAVTIAKARYAEFEEKIREKVGAATRGNMPNSASPNTEALEEQELENQINQLDTDKYENDPEYREKILGQMEQAYLRATGAV